MSGSLPDDLQSWIARKLGHTISLIKFGGVIGKLALIAVAVVLALAWVSGRAGGNIPILWACVIGITFVGVYAIGLGVYYAHKHPREATLEGLEMVALQHVQHYAMKGQPDLPESTPIPARIGMGDGI